MLIFLLCVVTVFSAKRSSAYPAPRSSFVWNKPTSNGYWWQRWVTFFLLSISFIIMTGNLTWSFRRSWQWYRLGWFTAYLANVFLTKVQGPIWPGESRDNINPNYPSWSYIEWVSLHTVTISNHSTVLLLYVNFDFFRFFPISVMLNMPF